jgi:ubiquinone biosynthesis protein
VFRSSLRSVRNIPRYQEIAAVFIKHGFGFIFENLGSEMLQPFRRVLKQRPKEFPLRSGEYLASHFRLALEELGPTFVKLGQVLSTRPDLLPPRYITELSKLQDTVPPVPWISIRGVLIEELDIEPEVVFTTFDHQPMAAASLAQVHAATLPNGEEVVVKIQRPNILNTIEKDLNVLADLAERFQTTALGRLYNLVEIEDDFAYTLHSELDYRREGYNAERFRMNFAKESFLYVPKVYWEYTTPRVLVLERIRGIKIDDLQALDVAEFDRHKIALNAAHLIVKEILEDGFFHADPHPGNLLIMPNEIIGAMDFGMVGHLKEIDRINLIRLYIAAVEIQIEAFIDQLIHMGAADIEVDRIGLARDTERLLTQYANIPLQDIHASDVLDDVRPIMFRYHLRLPSDFWLLAKTLVMLEGIGLRLDPSFDIFEVSKPYVTKLTWQLLMPSRRLAQDIMRKSKDWGDFLDKLPRAGSSLLTKAERGELFYLTIKDTDRLVNQLDRVFTRLSLSVMISAIIIGMAMLTPLFSNGSLVQWLLLLGFIIAFILAVWFLISMLRSSR